LGSTGLVLLQLGACNASKDSGQSGARDERVDQTSVDADAGAKQPDGDPQTKPKCPYDPSQPEEVKWKNTLVRPREFAPTTPGGNEYRVTIADKMVQMLPDCYPETQVFAYGGSTRDLGETESKETWSSPGPTFEMTRGKTAHVTWVNEIGIDHLFPVDPTLHWANPKDEQGPATGPFPAVPPYDSKYQGPVPVVTHVHGLEVASDFDGAPEAWFTPGAAIVGKKYITGPSEYPNSQPATTLWYHDHALGITRLNVYAGLAGMYIIRDENDPYASKLPDREHEWPLVIQDKDFNADGSLNYGSGGSDHHPYWQSASGGGTMVVNGKVWPKMTVERARYRFRVLNGANYSSFNLSLTKPESLKEPLRFTVIGSDGGYLDAPADTPVLKLAPGERADVVIDFSRLLPGETTILSTDGTDVVKFEVPLAAADPKLPSCVLTRPRDETVPPLCFPNGLNTSKLETKPETKPDSTRTLTLVEGPDHELLLNGQMFTDEATETPKLGTTEDWNIVNTMDSDHPIHLHLVQFKLLERRPISDDFFTQWKADNGGELPLHHAPTSPKLDTYVGDATLPVEVADTGWKDTIVAPGKSVTRIRVRWAPQDGGKFPFDAWKGVGYVWHCHMLEHEDNEMMRPLMPVE
jgi:FtsP/CotA-like multicopper oxidase with cupredoxin domain